MLAGEKEVLGFMHHLSFQHTLRLFGCVHCCPCCWTLPKQHTAQHKQDRSCWLHCAADLIMPANHEWALVCVSMPSPHGHDCIWTAEKAASGRTSQAWLSPSPWCPIKFCYTTQMLHSRLGFQEIITEWDGQHPVAVGENLHECVVANAMYVSLCVSTG